MGGRIDQGGEGRGEDQRGDPSCYSEARPWSLGCSIAVVRNYQIFRFGISFDIRVNRIWGVRERVQSRKMPRFLA